MLRIVIALATFLFLVGLCQGQQGQGIKAVVTSLEIRKPLSKEFESEFDNLGAGTAVRVLIDLGGKYIVGVERDSSKLHEFVDDKGNDLKKVEKKSKYPVKDWVWPFILKSKDGSQCIVDLFGPSVPAAGAKLVKIRADIVIQCGSDEKTAEVKDVAIDDKLRVQIGPFMAVRGKSVIADEGTIKLQCEENKFIKSVTVLADKNEFQLDSDSSSRLSVAGKDLYECSFRLGKALNRGLIRVVYLDKLEHVTVPVDLQIGVGF